MYPTLKKEYYTMYPILQKGFYTMYPVFRSILMEEHKVTSNSVKYTYPSSSEIHSCIHLPTTFSCSQQGVKHQEREDKSSTDSAHESSLSPT